MPEATVEMTCDRMEPGRDRPETPDRLVLGSNLSGMERLPAWVDAMAAKFGLSERTKFAVHLCLEEVVSNVIRHGYGSKDGQSLTVECEPRDGYFIFTVDDDAAPFNPLEFPALPAIGQESGQQGPLGGQGLRLLRGFADTLEYEPKASGNRLRIGFSNPASQAKNIAPEART